MKIEYRAWMSNCTTPTIPYSIHCVPGVSGLGQKHAIIKKSTIFIRSLQNFDKRRYS